MSGTRLVKMLSGDGNFERPSNVNFPNGSYGNFSNRDINPVTTSALNGAFPNGEYTFRAPSPPHIHIPQPMDDQKFTLNIPGDCGYSLEEEAILARVIASEHSTHGTVDWKYEDRRKPQQVLKFLYLGPSSGARDVEALRQEGITMLLVVRNTMTAQARLLSGDKVAMQLGIESATIDVAGNQELIAAFPGAVKIINDHLISSYHRLSRPDDVEAGRDTWGKVLVFCESGNERSAAVIAAYMMSMFALNMVGAIQYVQSKRFCVAFDDGLKNLLQAYEDILLARRTISRSRSTSAVPQRDKRKVYDRDSEDDDMDMGGSMDTDDTERFAARKSYAPFLDV